MSFWSTIIADLEALLEKVKTAVEADAGIIWSDLKQIISTDAQTLYNDFGPDLQQIAINIQNTQGGISLANFIPAFIAAAVPVAEKEALNIGQIDWNIIANSFAGKFNIPTIAGNAGNLPQGNSATPS